MHHQDGDMLLRRATAPLIFRATAPYTLLLIFSQGKLTARMLNAINETIKANQDGDIVIVIQRLPQNVKE